MKLRKRTYLFGAKARRSNPLAKAFLAPQRIRPAKAQYPKPMCGMCGGKVHTRTDFTTGDGWWLCPTCDLGAEVGMPRAA